MKELEDAVLCQVRGMAAMLIEAKNIRRKEQKSDRRTVLETPVADSAKEITRRKDTKVRLHEQSYYCDMIEKGI